MLRGKGYGELVIRSLHPDKDKCIKQIIGRMFAKSKNNLSTVKTEKKNRYLEKKKKVLAVRLVSPFREKEGNSLPLKEKEYMTKEQLHSDHGAWNRLKYFAQAIISNASVFVAERN